MLVYGLIAPHPPIIIPAIGKESTKKVKRTIAALERAASKLGQANPQELILISPHEGHGFEVPLYYLQPHLPTGIRIQELLVTEVSYRYYFDFGREIGEKIKHDQQRYAIVASGDLSHVLKADGPYSYDPAGPVLDEQIVRAIRNGDAKALLDIDPQTLEQGAECGLRSILFLLGALEGMDFRPKILSYEGPFGVGYLVATFETALGPVFGNASDADTAGYGDGSPLPTTATVTAPALARAAIKHYLRTGKLLTVSQDQLPENLRQRSGAFVSLYYKTSKKTGKAGGVDGELRGCIGTTAPTQATLAEEIIANAVSAATQDPRFPPVSMHELSKLAVHVDVLSSSVPEADPLRLDPKRYGLIVEAADGRRGVLLPDIEGVETVGEQIAICRDKGGIGPEEPVTMRVFQSMRYQDGI